MRFVRTEQEQWDEQWSYYGGSMDKDIAGKKLKGVHYPLAAHDIMKKYR